MIQDWKFQVVMEEWKEGRTKKECFLSCLAAVTKDVNTQSL